jgi:phosphoribosylanthranilate isomerase
MRTRIKICGITRVADALAAAACGADAVGLVFYPPSPRGVTVPQAQAICRALPPFVSRVGLFVDASLADIQAILTQVALDTVQLHGDETPELAAQLPLPYIKALRMRADRDLPAEIARYPDAAGILLDTYVPGTPGGTGLCFDWAQIPAQLAKPWILAGGLTPANVTAALRQVRPYAVDVSGGVELSRGIKDQERLAAFCAAVTEMNPS